MDENGFLRLMTTIVGDDLVKSQNPMLKEKAPNARWANPEE
jgi:hypothetical protein